MNAAVDQGFRIGPYCVFPKAEKIQGPEGEQHLEPKVMQVLVVLAQKQGQVVSRQALLDEVWSDAVVGDEVLSRAISLLRSCLGDERTNPKYIRTAPRQGYELIEPVLTLKTAVNRRRWLPLGGFAALLIPALLWMASPDPQTRASIAVLPPKVLSDEADLGFVSEGIAEHLINGLSRISSLEVVARRASFGVRDADLNLDVIGDRLNANYLFEGSLRRERDKLHLSLFLVDIDAGTNLWSEELTGERLAVLEDTALAAAQSALAGVINVDELTLPPIAETEISESAYRKYLEARYQWTLRGEKRIARSIELLRECIAQSPNFAPAYLALAQSLAMQPFYTEAPLDAQFQEARALSRQAEQMSVDMQADVLALEGFMSMKEWQWQLAGEALRAAIDRDAGNVNARYWYSIYLAQLGRYEESLLHMQRAIELDPISAVFNDRMGLAHVYVGNLEAAKTYFETAKDLGYLESTQPLGVLLYLLRRKAWDEMQAYLLRIGGDAGWVVPLVSGLRNPAKRDDAVRSIESYPENALLKALKVPTWVLYGEYDRAFSAFMLDPKTLLAEFLWIDEAKGWRAEPQFEVLLQNLQFTGAASELVSQN